MYTCFFFPCYFGMLLKDLSLHIPYWFNWKILLEILSFDLYCKTQYIWFCLSAFKKRPSAIMFSAGFVLKKHLSCRIPNFSPNLQESRKSCEFHLLLMQTLLIPYSHSYHFLNGISGGVSLDKSLWHWWHWWHQLSLSFAFVWIDLTNSPCCFLMVICFSNTT